jgi:5-methylcytosine-specific restriction endonuclease McrA
MSGKMRQGMDRFILNGKQYPWFSRMTIDQWREIRQFIYDRDGGLCQYCEQPTRLDKCHIHHVFELNEGGTNHPTNLKTLCVTCHKNRHPFMKSAKDKLQEML